VGGRRSICSYEVDRMSIPNRWEFRQTFAEGLLRLPILIGFQ